MRQRWIFTFLGLIFLIVGQPVQSELEPHAGGQLLISELSCVACHPSQRSELQPKRGPRLTGAGNHLQQKWIREFLAAPQITKAGTTMPDVLHGLPPEKKQQTITALNQNFSL